MKFYVEYYSDHRGYSMKRGWGIVEFAFRDEITKESIQEQLIPSYINNFHVSQMVKL